MSPSALVTPAECILTGATPASSPSPWCWPVSWEPQAGGGPAPPLTMQLQIGSSTGAGPTVYALLAVRRSCGFRNTWSVQKARGRWLSHGCQEWHPWWPPHPPSGGSKKTLVPGSRYSP